MEIPPQIYICTSVGCTNHIPFGVAHCDTCLVSGPPSDRNLSRRAHDQAIPLSRAGTMAERYPKYYKQIPKGVDCLDVYAVCEMFPVKDDSGAINHARKKLLVTGTRTGGKTFYDDIKEARDTLTRWLEMHSNIPNETK